MLLACNFYSILALSAHPLTLTEQSAYLSSFHPSVACDECLKAHAPRLSTPPCCPHSSNQKVFMGRRPHYRLKDSLTVYPSLPPSLKAPCPPCKELRIHRMCSSAFLHFHASSRSPLCSSLNIRSPKPMESPHHDANVVIDVVVDRILALLESKPPQRSFSSSCRHLNTWSSMFATSSSSFLSEDPLFGSNTWQILAGEG